jgi:hypothetical protein
MLWSVHALQIQEHQIYFVLLLQNKMNPVYHSNFTGSKRYYLYTYISFCIDRNYWIFSSKYISHHTAYLHLSLQKYISW